MEDQSKHSIKITPQTACPKKKKNGGSLAYKYAKTYLSPKPEKQKLKSTPIAPVQFRKAPSSRTTLVYRRASTRASKKREVV